MLPDFRVRQRDYLLEISRTISQELNLEKVLARIIRISAEMLAGQAGLIVLRREQGGWEVASLHGITPGFLRYINTLLGQIQSADDPIQHELPQVRALIEDITESASFGLMVSVDLPMVMLNQLIGVIVIFRSYMGIFSANDRTLLQSFADQAAIAVHNAKSYTEVSREKQRMDALLDTVADGIMIMRPDGMVERCNPSFSRMMGVNPQQIIGKQHETVIRWKVKRHGMALEEAEAGGWPLMPNATLYVEGDLERDGRSVLPVGITYAPLLSAEGHLLNTIAVIRDITRFREAEEMKSTFISVISHELKTPVALIKGYVATLRRDDAAWDQEVVNDSLQVIEEEADRLTGLIDNLLDASRLQAGGLKISLAQIAVDKLVERVVKKFSESENPDNRHKFSLQISADTPVVMGDEDRLTQVLNNLVSNAIKYSPNNSEISIIGQVRQDEVIVCVSDEGPGIAPADVPHIFDSFYRSAETSRNTKGAGLGLYLTRAIVEAHGGRIWVDQRYENGAKVCFSVPR
jgi:PAS domain S-box-containing protein